MFLFGKPNIEKLAENREIEKLAECLENHDPLIRLEAAQALAELSDMRG